MKNSSGPHSPQPSSQTSDPLAPMRGPVEPDDTTDDDFQDPVDDDDTKWDVFLPDDDQLDPLPEPGDIWLDQS